MNELQKSERKRRIVFKKAILVMIYLVILFFVYVGISAYVSLNTIALFLGTVIFMSITLPRLFGYVQRSYHCVPYFNEIFTKKELEELFEHEMFSEIVFLKENGMSFVDIAESEHWLRFNWQYISKELTIMGKMETNVLRYRRRQEESALNVMYLTGDKVKIKWEHRLDNDTMRRFNVYIWQKLGIWPEQTVGKEYKKICDTLKEICRDYRVEHEGMSKKEMLRRHIQDGGSLRRTCEEHLPVYIKHGKEKRLKEGKIQFDLNEKDKNEMLDAVLKKGEFYQCRLCGRFKVSARAYKKMGWWLLPRRPYILKFGSFEGINNKRCYLGMTQKRIYVILIDPVNEKRITEKFSIPIADIVKTKIKRKMRAGETWVTLCAKNFKVKIILPDYMSGIDLQQQKVNYERFCRLLERLQG